MAPFPDGEPLLRRKEYDADRRSFRILALKL
jgi:hypothetical protein